MSSEPAYVRLITTVKRYQVWWDGNKYKKQRRGWSRRNCNVSYKRDSLRTRRLIAQLYIHHEQLLGNNENSAYIKKRKLHQKTLINSDPRLRQVCLQYRLEHRAMNKRALKGMKARTKHVFPARIKNAITITITYARWKGTIDWSTRDMPLFV